MKTELKSRMQIMKQVRDAIKSPYAWPGGYEKFAVCNDGGALCHKCLESEHAEIAHDTIKGWQTGWDVAGVECSANYDDDVTCEHCGSLISA